MRFCIVSFFLIIFFVSRGDAAKVSDAPKLVALVEELNNPEDTNATITCSVGSGEINGLTYEWYRDKERIFSNSNKIRIDIPTENYQSVLRVFNLVSDDSALYTCIARNRFGHDKISTRLNVRVQLKWIDQPKDVQVSANKLVNIPCRAEGSPPPKIEWHKIGPESGDSTLVGPELRFQSIGVDNSGYYECRASNGVDEDLITRVKLEVLDNQGRGQYNIQIHIKITAVNHSKQFIMVASELARLIKFAGISAGITLLGVNEIGLVAKVEGHSMQPTFNPNCGQKNESLKQLFDRGEPKEVVLKEIKTRLTQDRVFLNKWLARDRTKLKVGDVVILICPTNPNKTLIKRIIAMPGDVILNTATDENHVIREGHCWVEGDNKQCSYDSNNFGQVPLGLIEGLVCYIVWPWNRMQAINCDPNISTKSGKTVLVSQYKPNQCAQTVK